MASTPAGHEVTPEPAPLGPGRHEARERAIGMLYELETRELSAAELLAGLPLEPNPYAAEALRGVEAEQIRIDQLIDENADGWTVGRLPNVDRAILRLAIWELLARDDVPPAVVINEAIELAKEYSTERSASFVNGVLDATARSLHD